MNILAITQARVGSSRLPAKILKTINDESLLEIHLKRILKSKKIDKLKVATTKEKGVEKILNIAKNCQIETYQGSLNDVLDRFYQTAKGENPDYVVRLTSDCPLVDSGLIDEVINFTIENGLDYCSNTFDEMYPDGQDVEVFKFCALEKACQESVAKLDREHVTPYIWRNSTYKGGKIFISNVFPAVTNYRGVRLTVDELCDFEAVKKLVEKLGTEASWLDYTKCYLEENIAKINCNIQRNEGYLKSLKEEQNG